MITAIVHDQLRELAITQPTTTRIVACQGAVQLASGIAAMWTTSGRTVENPSLQNHLVIHDLSAPETQAVEFADCIEQLAGQVERWQSVHFLTLGDTLEMQSQLGDKQQSPTQLLEAKLGIRHCAELYVGQNNKWIPTWLRKATPAATHVCFGDGIALNFTNSYYRPKEFNFAQNPPTWRGRIARLCRKGVPRLLSRSEESCSSETDFNSHCLLLKNLFDEQLDRVELIDRSLFIEQFEKYGDSFAARAPVAHAGLSQLAASAGKTAILLTSNFSETGRMSLASEVQGYCELLQAMPQGDNTTLVIKPHPRDSYEKIELLRKLASRWYGQCIALSDPWTFYLPFESLYVRYFGPGSGSARETHVATVSSACISLEYLYGQRCVQGFGDSFVDRHFSQLWRPLRKLHERDLLNIVARLRNKNTTKARISQAAA